MAQRDTTTFKATKNARYTANTSGDISSGDGSDMFEDVADSFLNITDHLVDDDTFATASPSTVPSSESVKAYVDAQLAGGGIRHATVTVSSAEILSLKTTRVTLIAAPGANKIINVLNVTCFYNYGTATYTNGTPICLNYGSVSTSDMWRSNVLSQTVDSFTFSKFADPIYSVYETGDIRNQAIMLRANGAADPTVGDGTLKFVISYEIIDFT